MGGMSREGGGGEEHEKLRVGIGCPENFEDKDNPELSLFLIPMVEMI